MKKNIVKKLKRASRLELPLRSTRCSKPSGKIYKRAKAESLHPVKGRN